MRDIRGEMTFDGVKVLFRKNGGGHEEDGAIANSKLGATPIRSINRNRPP